MMHTHFKHARDLYERGARVSGTQARSRDTCVVCDKQICRCSSGSLYSFKLPLSPAKVVHRGECGRALGLYASEHRVHVYFYLGICCSYEVLHVKQNFTRGRRFY